MDGLAELEAAHGRKKRASDSSPCKRTAILQAIENLRKEMAGIQDEIQREVIAHIMESKKILDPNQQQRFFDLMRQTMIQAKNSWPPTKWR